MKINTNNAKALVRGYVNPFLFKFWQASYYDISNTVLISGRNRSGTTWLAELIAAVPGSTILFEPFHVQNMKEAKKIGFKTRNYVFPEADWPEGEEYMRRVFTGQVLTPWTTSHIPIRIKYNIDRWVVKDICTNPMLEWIIVKFPIRPPLLLIRHPCAVLASIIKRGWGNNLSKYIKADMAFMGRYPQFRSVLAGLTTVEEVFTARWCIDYYLPLSMGRPYPFQLVSYEQLLNQGPDALVPVFARLGLDMPEHIDQLFHKPSAKASHDYARQRKNPGWHKILSKDQVERMLIVLKHFNMDFYQDDPEPDYQTLFSDNPLRLG